MKNSRCPECLTPSIREHETPRPLHRTECSQATVDDLRLHLEEAKQDTRRYRKWMLDHIQNSQRWEGKYRIVKHENNQLRKKLFPAKTNGIKNKETAPG